MISSALLAQDISLDLDQNAYTTWYDSPKILRAINSACEFIQSYMKWPRTLVLETKQLTNATDTFTLDNEVLYPYWAELNEIRFDRTNIPLIWRKHEPVKSFYVSWNVIKTSDTWTRLDILYHKWFKALTSLWYNDIEMPWTMWQLLLHTALWFIYPSGLDIGSSLSNQHYNMVLTLLQSYGKAYGFDMQPEAAKAISIYNK